MDELEQLSGDFVKLQKNFKLITAAGPAVDSGDGPMSKSEMYQCMQNMHSHIQASMNNIHDRIDRLHQRHSNHQEGHLPPMKSASQMETALKALGMAGDYNVAKPTVYPAHANSYAYASTKGKVLEIGYSKPKQA